MSYLVLYRKLRPTNFKSVFGQDHIVRTLINQLKAGRLSHAYLFCGTRGTGKTTMAKILAKAVNCLESADNEPCGKCQACISIGNGTNLNVIEIDAASNNGVDNIRDIREEVKYPPTEALYKVYIIDEAHMLSTGAFNALLKTLEEPPAHVIFILATTDPQKIPPTIHSRCQRFDFKRISKALMAEKLSQYAKLENADIEPSAIDYITELSDGSVRDALSLLEQCISFYYGETVTLEKVLEITGSVSKTVFLELINALYTLDSNSVINIISEAVMQGRDISQMVSELILSMRNILVETASHSTVEAYNPAIDRDTLIHYIYEFSKLQSALKHSSNDKILFETACIKLCNPQVKQGSLDGAIEKRLESLERQLKSRPAAQVVASGEHPADKAKAANKVVKKTPTPENEKNLIEKWNDFAQKTGKGEYIFIKKTKLQYEQNTLYIVCENPVVMSALKNKEDDIKARLKKSENLDFEFRMITEKEFGERFGAGKGIVEDDASSDFYDLKKNMGLL